MSSLWLSFPVSKQDFSLVVRVREGGREGGRERGREGALRLLLSEESPLVPFAFLDRWWCAQPASGASSPSRRHRGYPVAEATILLRKYWVCQSHRLAESKGEEAGPPSCLGSPESRGTPPRIFACFFSTTTSRARTHRQYRTRVSFLISEYTATTVSLLST